MKFTYGRLGGTILALASILVATNAREAAAQEASSRQPATLCSGGTPTFVEPMSAPHWNGWGADLSQHRFQPAEMAQLAAKDVPRLRLKWAFGFRRHSGVHPADCLWWPHFCRQPSGKGLLARRQSWVHLLGVRCGHVGADSNYYRKRFSWLGGLPWRREG